MHGMNVSVLPEELIKASPGVGGLLKVWALLMRGVGVSGVGCVLHILRLASLGSVNHR